MKKKQAISNQLWDTARETWSCHDMQAVVCLSAEMLHYARLQISFWVYIQSDRNADRAVVKRMPLTPPNVERATNTGITHAMTPYIRSANVCDIHATRHPLHHRNLSEQQFVISLNYTVGHKKPCKFYF